MSLLSVIIPTMNEEQSIGMVIDDLSQALNQADIKYEILVVDTNSKDRTKEIATEKGAKIVEEPRRGYGRAYKTGFNVANGDYIATLDADCTYPAESIPDLIRIMEQEELQFITTDRFGELQEGSMSLKHRFGNWVLTFNLNLLFKLRINDSQSGMWVFRRECLSSLDVTSDGMPFSEEIKIEAFRNLASKEIPIIYRRRVGEVKLSSWKDGKENLLFLWKKRFFKN